MRNIRKTAKKERSGGYAMLELLFYVFFFSALSLAVISSLITMGGSFRETVLYTKLVRQTAVVERISREIRGAESIVSIGAGTLKLGTTDSAGSPKTVEFSLSGTDVRLLENDVLVGSLNASDVAVDTLSFTEITTSEGKGVKMHMTFRSKNDMAARMFDFYTTVVLRGSY